MRPHAVSKTPPDNLIILHNLTVLNKYYVLCNIIGSSQHPCSYELQLQWARSVPFVIYD